jgi:glycosyltransferase involved in cell wall biosynthesis
LPENSEKTLNQADDRHRRTRSTASRFPGIRMTSQPLVTAVIPCFNAASTLLRAIESVRRQSYPQIEIIAVDDGSRDDTPALLRQQQAHGVRVITQPNGGAPAARNAGITAARGEFLAFLDADDEWHPDKLAQQMRVLASHPGMVLIGCWVEVVGLDGSRRKVNAGREPPIGTEAWRTLLHHSFYNPSALVARTEVARRIGGFITTLRAGHEDQDFCIRLALEGEVGFVDAVLATMYQQPGSLSRTHFSREHETVLPMILGHCRALAPRLSRAELRQILGARYSQIGRNVYPGAPAIGFWLLARAICYGAEPLGNLRYLVTAAPWSRRLKRRLLPRPR